MHLYLHNFSFIYISFQDSKLISDYSISVQATFEPGMVNTPLFSTYGGNGLCWLHENTEYTLSLEYWTNESLMHFLNAHHIH
jgi:hypothetical protein